MADDKKYFFILRRGSIWLAIAVFILLAIIFAAQAAPYIGWTAPFSVSQRGENLDPAIMAAQEEDSLFGTVSIHVKNDISVPKAYLLINGQKSGDFASGSILVRVYEGDKLEIDASRYEHDIIFDIDNMSANIEENYMSNRLLLNNEIGFIGTVHFK
jgi:hypothetical protein